MNYNKNTNQKIRTHIKWAEKMANIGKNTDSKWRKKSKKKKMIKKETNNRTSQMKKTTIFMQHDGELFEYHAWAHIFMI